MTLGDDRTNEGRNFISPSPGFPAPMLTPPMLADAFPSLAIELLEEHDSEVSEGLGHSGMSALIDLVARKPG